MARASTPRKKKENYFQVGERGRATGTILKDTGVRDEFGMEPIEGIFSSPGGTTRTTRRENDITSESSESMDVEKSSGPTPAQALSQRRVTRDGKSFGPPPMSRSPIKTNIGATPRRQSGPASSPQKSTQTQSTSRTRVNRLLEFGPTYPVNAPQDNVEATSTITSVRSKTNALQRRRSVFSIEATPEVEQSDARHPKTYAPEEELINGVSDLYVNRQDNVPIDPALDDGYQPRFGDDDMDENMDQDDVDAVDEQREGETEAGVDEEIEDVEEQSDASMQEDGPSMAQPTIELSSGRRGRPRRSDVSTGSQHGLPNGVDQDDEPEPEPAPRKNKGGRPRKGTALARKDGNATLAWRFTEAPEKKRGRVDPAIGRSLQRTRHETPADDEARRTRYGRLTYKPLSYWKGERAIQPAPLQSIQEIIRMDDVTPQKRDIKQGRNRRQRKRKFTVFEEEDDPDDGEEPWEQEEGVITGPVKSWDPILQLSGLEDDEDQELAFAASKIEPREVLNGEFLFAKTLTLPFFGAGIVELPPRGFKRAKNSRKMQMCFFVHFGKVAVEVGETEFIITKGGMWQVPRGNMYTITNLTDRGAKVFFAQGCEEPGKLQEPDALTQNNVAQVPAVDD